MLHRRVVFFVLATCLSVVANAATVDVHVANFSFTPKTVTIGTGDTVHWIFDASFHNVTSDNGAFPGSGLILTPGATYDFTFPNAGTFPYYCSIHSTPASLGGIFMNGTITVVVKSDVTMSLTTSKDTTVYGENATLTATVAPFPPATGTPTGTVTFLDGSSTLCAAATLTAGGTATCSTVPLGFGSHGIFARYNGDANFNTFFGGPVLQTVVPAPSTTTLGSSLNPSAFNQNVTFTATVTIDSPGSGIPTGDVTFYESLPICADVALQNSVATCSTSALSPGVHSINATYFGDGNVFSSAPPTLFQSVGPAVPPSFSANAQSATTVALQWASAEGATTYEVVRREHVGDPPTTIIASTNLTSGTDSMLTPNTTYLYQVRASGATGTSAFSPIDVATTVIFTNGSLAGAPIEGLDMSEVRTAVNAMHVAANLGGATFTDDPSAPGTLIKSGHIIELRTQLDDARLQIGVPALIYAQTITAGTTLIKAGDVTELRAGTQ